MGLFDRLAGRPASTHADADDIEQPPLSAASMEQAKRAMQALQQQGAGAIGSGSFGSALGIHQLANAQGMMHSHLFDPYGRDDFLDAQKFVRSQQQVMQLAAQAKKDAEEARKKNSPNNRPAFQCTLASLKDTWRARFGEEWVDTKNPPWEAADQYWRDAHERLVTNKAFEIYDGWVRLHDEE